MSADFEGLGVEESFVGGKKDETCSGVHTAYALALVVVIGELLDGDVVDVVGIPLEER